MTASWVLYIQYRKGRQIATPKDVPGVILSSDIVSRHLYAFQGTRNAGELFQYTVNFARDGIFIDGYEQGGPSLPAYWQRWWVSPEWGEATKINPE